MESSTHSRELPKNLPKAAKENELEQVATTCFETEMTTLSLSRRIGMGMAEVGGVFELLTTFAKGREGEVPTGRNRG